METSNGNGNGSHVQKVETRTIADAVLAKIKVFESNKEIRLPDDYSVENAIKSAFLIIQETKDRNNKPALEVCTKESIANSLLKMVVWGLSPLKKQCDFIVYGNELQCTPEYTGNIALAKRYGGLKRIKANAIFKGDEFAFEIDGNTGLRKVTKHTQTLESIGSTDVIGAYAVIEMEDGTFDTEIMNINQIKAAWNQGAMKGGSPAHKNFPDQMAAKTVINRACKLLIRSSSDSVLFDSEEKEETERPVQKEVRQEIQQKANKTPLSIEDAAIVTNEPVRNESVHNEPEYTDSEVVEEPALVNPEAIAGF